MINLGQAGHINIFADLSKDVVTDLQLVSNSNVYSLNTQTAMAITAVLLTIMTEHTRDIRRILNSEDFKRQYYMWLPTPEAPVQS